MITFSRECDRYILVNTLNNQTLNLSLVEARAVCRYLMIELNIIDAVYLDDEKKPRNVFEMDRLIRDLYHFKYKKPWGKK